MKIGELKHDIDVKTGTGKNFLGIYHTGIVTEEGKTILKKNPNYTYLKNDPMINKQEPIEFYRSVVYAYMKDEILKCNPSLICEHDKIVKKYRENITVIDNIGKPYSLENYQFLMWYLDYLREQENPGILEQEKIQKEINKKKKNEEATRKQEEIKRKAELNRIKENQQLQQDLASGKRVVCPYCKSTNTEKISTVSRAVSVSLVGATSGKIGKQWHCKACGSNF